MQLFFIGGGGQCYFSCSKGGVQLFLFKGRSEAIPAPKRGDTIPVSANISASRGCSPFSKGRVLLFLLAWGKGAVLLFLLQGGGVLLFLLGVEGGRRGMFSAPKDGSYYPCSKGKVLLFLLKGRGKCGECYYSCCKGGE